jgi:hypothetical protein
MYAPNRTRPTGSLAQQRQPLFNQMYGLRPTTTRPTYDNDDDNPDNNDAVPYEESMNTNTIDDLSDMFNMLVLKPTPAAYNQDEIDAASVLLNLNNNQLLQLTNVVDDQSSTDASPDINVNNLLHRLFIIVIRLPIESARLFNQTVTTENMNIIKNNILNMIKQFLLIIKIIITIPTRIGKLTKQIYSQVKYMSLGMLVLIIITTMLYQTPATQPFMLFIFSIIRYLSGVDIPTVAGGFIEFLKQQTKQFFAITMAGKLASTLLSESSKMVSQTASQVASQVSSQVSTEVSSQVEQALRSTQAQNAITMALTNPSSLAALSLTVSTGVSGQLELVMNDVVLPQLAKIQDIVEGTSVKVIDLNIKSDEMLAIFKSDLLLLKESINTIENGQEMTEMQLNKALVLLQKNLQTTDLGRIMNANGVIITHDNVMALLRTAQSAVESVLGRNVQGQYMLKNEGGRRTRRNRNKHKPVKKQKTRKKQRVRKSNKHKKRSKFKLKSKKK